MNIVKRHKYFLYIFACLVMYKSVRHIYAFVKERFAPRSISITCKNIYSDELRYEIEQSVIKYLSGRSYANVSLPELHKNLKQHFKMIKKISLNWGAWSDSELVVEGVRPLFFVNDMFVLGEKRRLFPTVFFSDISMDTLRCVSLDFSLCGIKVPRHVYGCLQKIPKDYWELYKIFYHSRERIELEKKYKSTAHFVVNEETLFDRKKMKRAEYLSVYTKRKYVAYDLRFDNRIYAKVIGRRKGG